MTPVFANQKTDRQRADLNQHGLKDKDRLAGDLLLRGPPHKNHVQRQKEAAAKGQADTEPITGGQGQRKPVGAEPLAHHQHSAECGEDDGGQRVTRRFFL